MIIHPGAKHKLLKACCTIKAYYGDAVIEFDNEDMGRIDNKVKLMKEIFTSKQYASALFIR